MRGVKRGSRGWLWKPGRRSKAHRERLSDDDFGALVVREAHEALHLAAQRSHQVTLLGRRTGAQRQQLCAAEARL